jgi:hypothetical protein
MCSPKGQKKPTETISILTVFRFVDSGPCDRVGVHGHGAKSHSNEYAVRNMADLFTAELASLLKNVAERLQQATEGHAPQSVEEKQ